MARGTPLLKAIDLFRQAIEADRFNASAHNNLAAALMTKGDYYNAAKEFEEAIRLLPSNPDPRVNLGLLYENVGQLRNAQHQYEQALVVSPDYLQAVQSLARVRLRLGKRDEETETLLQTIVLRTSDAQWRKWAQRELSRSDLFAPAGTQPTAATTRKTDSVPR
jgi:tetratricopeptide (TPR) repeat protein